MPFHNVEEGEKDLELATTVWEKRKRTKDTA
jgi:hypothetical protein